eukprot:TRINITY_DN8401_c0_g2_i1.p1 TRINITY_DN8401_c0_g2~~TRINITY_DN8401_c0_g2_i1.p1  ORF type:complete len:305 (+),score=57.73 TRINITY_DN8401_c0_g2_i1:43-915(+)
MAAEDAVPLPSPGTHVEVAWTRAGCWARATMTDVGQPNGRFCTVTWPNGVPAAVRKTKVRLVREEPLREEPSAKTRSERGRRGCAAAAGRESAASPPKRKQQPSPLPEAAAAKRQPSPVPEAAAAKRQRTSAQPPDASPAPPVFRREWFWASPQVRASTGSGSGAQRQHHRAVWVGGPDYWLGTLCRFSDGPRERYGVVVDMWQAGDECTVLVEVHKRVSRTELCATGRSLAVRPWQLTAKLWLLERPSAEVEDSDLPRNVFYVAKAPSAPRGADGAAARRERFQAQLLR